MIVRRGAIVVNDDVVVDAAVIIIRIDNMSEWCENCIHLALRIRGRRRRHKWSPSQASWIDL